MSDLPSRILTVTLNPALDVSTTAPKVIPGLKLRCAAPHEDPGGGGVNVARAIHFLGGDAVAVVALGGPTGARLAELLSAEGITLSPLPAPGDTRRSLSVMDEGSGQQFRFLMPGPDWDAAALDAVLRAAESIFAPGDIVVISGSLPPGVPANTVLRLGRVAASAGALAVLDTSGPALGAIAAAGAGAGLVLRMDSEEAEMLADRPLSGPAALADFAAGLHRLRAADMVVVACGAEGSVLTTEAGRWHARPPVVPVVSKVGAGDSFVGAFSAALAAGKPPERALREGVAAAAAAVMTPDTRLCTAEDMAAILPGTRLSTL